MFFPSFPSSKSSKIAWLCSTTRSNAQTDPPLQELLTTNTTFSSSVFTLKSRLCRLHQTGHDQIVSTSWHTCLVCLSGAVACEFLLKSTFSTYTSCTTNLRVKLWNERAGKLSISKSTHSLIWRLWKLPNLLLEWNFDHRSISTPESWEGSDSKTSHEPPGRRRSAAGAHLLPWESAWHCRSGASAPKKTQTIQIDARFAGSGASKRVSSPRLQETGRDSGAEFAHSSFSLCDSQAWSDCWPGCSANHWPARCGPSPDTAISFYNLRPETIWDWNYINTKKQKCTAADDFDDVTVAFLSFTKDFLIVFQQIRLFGSVLHNSMWLSEVTILHTHPSRVNSTTRSWSCATMELYLAWAELGAFFRQGQTGTPRDAGKVDQAGFVSCAGSFLVYCFPGTGWKVESHCSKTLALIKLCFRKQRVQGKKYRIPNSALCCLRSPWKCVRHSKINHEPCYPAWSITSFWSWVQFGTHWVISIHSLMRAKKFTRLCPNKLYSMIPKIQVGYHAQEVNHAGIQVFRISHGEPRSWAKLKQLLAVTAAGRILPILNWDGSILWLRTGNSTLGRLGKKSRPVQRQPECPLQNWWPPWWLGKQLELHGSFPEVTRVSRATSKNFCLRDVHTSKVTRTWIHRERWAELEQPSSYLQKKIVDRSGSQQNKKFGGSNEPMKTNWAEP